MSDPRNFGSTALKYLYGRGALPIGIVSPNPGPLPTEDGPDPDTDSQGVPCERGRLREWTLELRYFATSGRNGNLYLEGSLDLAIWSPMSFFRLDTGDLIPSDTPLLIPPQTTLLLGLNRGLAIMGVRPRFWLTPGEDGDGSDYCWIRTLEML